MGLILIVDDEEDLCELMAESLEDIGYHVLIASGGKEALTLLEDHNIDLIISDLKMEEGDGMFLLESLRAKTKNPPPIVFITGFTHINAGTLMNKGARAIFHKPLNFDHFFDSINNYLA